MAPKLEGRRSVSIKLSVALAAIVLQRSDTTVSCKLNNTILGRRRYVELVLVRCGVNPWRVLVSKFYKFAMNANALVAHTRTSSVCIWTQNHNDFDLNQCPRSEGAIAPVASMSDDVHRCHSRV